MKKKYLSKRQTVAAACCELALLLSACGSSNSNVNENQDPLTGEEMSDTETSGTGESDDGQTGGDFGEFDTMLGDENTDPNDLMDYINTNIADAGEDDVERFFSGLLSFGDDIRDIDFTRLEDSRQYMPEDMIAFMDLMKLEADTPSMVLSDEENRRVINMTLSEMLERALLFEQHLEKYPDNVTTEAASRIYEEIATNAITGGYDSTEGIDNYYKGETEDVVDSEALQYYQQFAEANEDSNLGQIVSEYVTLLQTNQFQINDELEDFYMGLYARLDLDTWAGADDNADTDSVGASQTGTESGTDSSNASTGAADTVIEGTSVR
ncbi:MAG: hypothetical protein LUE96_12015 [Lachnospiraceae bacterium]|nr:hypothetical protein [Lachnospiraceae bacterium]